MEAEGASIVLPKELWAAAGEEQEQRREADPWEDKLRSVKGVVCDGGRAHPLHGLLSINIGIPIERQKSQDLKRVGEAMRNLRLDRDRRCFVSAKDLPEVIGGSRWNSTMSNIENDLDAKVRHRIRTFPARSERTTAGTGRQRRGC